MIGSGVAVWCAEGRMCSVEWKLWRYLRELAFLLCKQNMSRPVSPSSHPLPPYVTIRKEFTFTVRGIKRLIKIWRGLWTRYRSHRHLYIPPIFLTPFFYDLRITISTRLLLIFSERESSYLLFRGKGKSTAWAGELPLMNCYMEFCNQKLG
jgi:hypothetical protein